MSLSIIEAKNISKTYGNKNVVDLVSFEVKSSECFGLLGPNGAGKTSTMKMMYCASPVSKGELYVRNLNVRNHPQQVKSKIGVVPQEDGLDPDFSVLDNLLVYASYFRIPKATSLQKAKDLLRLMKLDDYSESRVETLSGGLKRRLVIARALINDPEILFLDEPTTGLDPQARSFIWDYLKKLKNQGTTLVLTTHYMEEADSLCDRIGIMDKGKILRIGSPGELVQEFIGENVVEFQANFQDINYYSGRLKAAQYSYQIFNDRIFVYLNKNQTLEQVMKIVVSNNMVFRKPGLNDVFLKLAGHELRDH